MIWLFLAVALYLAVVNAGFRKFLIWAGGIAFAMFVLFMTLFASH
jgi:hypothetical protein